VGVEVGGVVESSISVLIEGCRVFVFVFVFVEERVATDEGLSRSWEGLSILCFVNVFQESIRDLGSLVLELELVLEFELELELWKLDMRTASRSRASVDSRRSFESMNAAVVGILRSC